MKILVTGGMGFIGSHFVEVLKREGFKPKILDLKNGEDIRTSDIPKADLVFHFAALRSVPHSFENPSEFFSTNVYGTYRVMAGNLSARFVNISSSSAETMQSPYAISKKLSEEITKLSENSVSLRLFNVFGEGQTYNTLLPEFSRAMLANKEVKIFGNGEQSRDFTYVQDAANDVLWHGLNNTIGLHEVGYSESHAVNEIFEIMAKFYDYKKQPVYLPKRMGDFDKTKALEKMHIKPIGFEEGLKRTMTWWKQKD